MSLNYRTTPLPATWPGKRTPEYQRGPSRFKENWSGTLTLLEREINQLNGKDVTLAIGVTDRDIRNDGGVRADARVRDPAVILSFRAGADLLSFPCDRYNWWQDNVRAIALALEALRAVDRHGVQQGRQYQGFKALPATTSAPMSVEHAAVALAALADATAAAKPADILRSADTARSAFRSARNRHHPDRGGDRAQWDRVEVAAKVLTAHHGVTL